MEKGDGTKNKSREKGKQKNWKKDDKAHKLENLFHRNTHSLSCLIVVILTNSYSSFLCFPFPHATTRTDAVAYDT